MMTTKEQIQDLNHDMCVLGILGSGPSLSNAQCQACRIACRNGGYVEAGTGKHAGHVERVSASALRALIRRGLLNHCFGSEGGMAGQLSEKALARLATWIRE